MRHFIDLLDWNGDHIRKLLKEAASLKKDHLKGRFKPLLAGKVLGMIFEKPSLRTRASFEAAMAQLGGSAIFLASDCGMGSRESVPDIARTLSHYVDAVVLRTFRHQTLVDFARYSSCPVINGLSDYYHPCQALGDVLTIMEVFGKLPGRTVVFVGDANNVARSLAIACGKLDMNFILSSPKQYSFDRAFLDAYHQQVGGNLQEEADPQRAVGNADIIYTDVWASMGQEKEAAARKKSFAGYQVNADLLRLAPQEARVMHCLPAHRGEEITAEVLDGPQSVAFAQAGNRMHAQKALLQWVLNV